MSKMVVGMNNKPAINPHKIDCGFVKTALKADAVLFNHLPDAAVFHLSEVAGTRTTPITRPAMPIPIQNIPSESLPISGPTTNWPCRSAGHTKHLRRANQRRRAEGAKFFVAM